jgi:predicted ABC-type ATPase
MRVSQGGHDVRDDKLTARFPRTFDNRRAAIVRLPHVLVFDNSDLAIPYRQVADSILGLCANCKNPSRTGCDRSFCEQRSVRGEAVQAIAVS